MASVAVSDAPFCPNTTGVPAPRSYGLGRGGLYLAELTASDVPDANGFVHLGNVPELMITPTESFLEHYSSLAGLKQLDAKILIEQKFDLKFKLEELNEVNAGLFFSATPANYTNAAVAGFSEWTMIPTAKLGRWYPITNSSGQRAYGVTKANVTVKVGSTTYTLDTDYNVDEPGGRIFLLTTGGIAGAAAVKVTLAANANADATRQIPVQSRQGVTIALTFYGINPITNRNYELFVPKITLGASGDFGLITAGDLAGLSFTGSAQKKDSTTAVATITPLPIGGT